jgi:hypothetical protein
VELAKNGDVSAVVDLIQQRAVATRVTLGRNTRNSALNSTNPRASRGASLRSVTGAFDAAFGSSAKKARPRSFS